MHDFDFCGYNISTEYIFVWPVIFLWEPPLPSPYGSETSDGIWAKPKVFCELPYPWVPQGGRFGAAGNHLEKAHLGVKPHPKGSGAAGEAKMFSEPWIQPCPKSVMRLDFPVLALGWCSITYHLKSPDPYCHATWGQSQPVFIFVSSLLQPPL